MKFSEAWLREWVNPPIDTKKLTEQFTMAGLEVDSVTKVANDFSGVVVGYILSAEQHPDADRLRVCQVDVGAAEPLTIVCGAANARAGLKVAVAMIGAQLSADFVIRTTKLRGVVSHGMICSAEELGLAEKSEGILELDEDAPIGANFREYLHLDDHSIDVDLTPNRGDCLSVFGIAREVAAINALDYPQLPHSQVAPSEDITFPVKIAVPEDCPQYVGRVISGISMNAKTPVWMKERLRRSGLRSIHVVVDVTNYVLLELGQPLHAFDLDKLEKSIVVRRAQAGEPLTLLDGRTIELDEQTLVIADEKKPIALAGIMGGLDSAITEQTRQVFLESAFFNPLTLAGRARRFGLSTDASHRFERFVCPDLQTVATERATQLLIEIAGGVAGPLITVRQGPFLPEPVTVLLRKERIERVLGVCFTDTEIEQLLLRLNMQLTAVNEGWQVKVPLYRFDVQEEIDVIEEIARMYGYEKIAPAAVAISVNPGVQTDHKVQREIQRYLQSRGYHEAITYSFVDPRVQAWLSPDEAALTLENPISSKLSVMRTTLWPGLLQAVGYNQSRQQRRVRLFEMGLRFSVTSEVDERVLSLASPLVLPKDRTRGFSSATHSSTSDVTPKNLEGGSKGVQEENADPPTRSFAQLRGEACVGGVRQDLVLAGVVTDTRYPEQWGCAKAPVDFFDVKADLEGLFASTRQEKEFTFKAGHHTALHPGQTAQIIYQNQAVGYVGALHPELLQRLDLEAPVYLFEIVLNCFLPKESRYAALSKFPAIRRDLAIVIDQAVSGMDVLNKIKSVGGECLMDAWIFDVYQGGNLLPSKKSLAIGLIWQNLERTLLDEEVAGQMQAVVDTLRADFDAALRE